MHSVVGYLDGRFVHDDVSLKVAAGRGRLMPRVRHAAPLLGACLGFLLCVPRAAWAGADDFETALEAAQRGDYAVAYCIWRPLAEGGHVPSQYHLGWMYANGEGLVLNEEEAVRWWRPAADKGHTEAQFRMAMAYLYGEGVEKDHARAIDWLLVVARKGDQDARSLLFRLAADGNVAALSLLRRLLKGGWEGLGDLRKVGVDRGNLRARPSTQSKVVTVVTQGQALVAWGGSGDWLQVGLEGTDVIAWVHRSIIRSP